MARDFENYFPHDANASSDVKIVMLVQDLGQEGKGIYWSLIELLRMQPTYTYPLKLIPAIANNLNTTSAKVDAVIKGYELFKVSTTHFLSESLIRRMAKKDANKHRNMISGMKGNLIRWGKVNKEEAKALTDQQIIEMNENVNTKRIANQ